MKEITVLIVHVSYQAAGSFIKMLRSSGKYKTKIIGCDSMPKGFSSGSMLVDVFYKIPDEIDNEQYIRLIKTICSENKVDIVISAAEEDLILFKDNKLNEAVPSFIAEKSIFDLFKDKHLANRDVEQIGLIVPNTILSHSDFVDSCEQIFIQRKRVSCSSRGIKILKRDEINSKYDFYNENYITQEFISGEMYTVDVICDKSGHPCIIVPRQTLASKDGTTFKCIIKKNDKLIKECIKVYNNYKIPGISNIQFIIKNDIPFFIELNPRAAATIIASSIASINLLDIYISHFYYGDNMPDLESFLKNVQWNSVVSRYYQETIYTKKEK